MGNQLCNLKGACHREPGNGAAFPLQMRKASSTERDYHHHPVFLGENLNGNKLYVNRRVGNRGKGTTVFQSHLIIVKFIIVILYILPARVLF